MNEFVDIALLRHGETEGGARYCGHTDSALTPMGWEQMSAAVDDEFRWGCVVSSPLKRCADFARSVAQRHAVSLRIDDRLREMHFGEWENCSALDIMQTERETLERFWRNPLVQAPPRGEPLSDVCTRVLQAWRDIVSTRRPTLVITHGGPIRVILSHERKTPMEQLLQIDVAHASLWHLYIPSTLAVVAPA
jgi:alpha-ribazole phosphatase